MNREMMVEFLKQHVVEENIIKHLYATEAAMGGLYERLLEGEKEEWMMAGLMHDGDYNPGVPVTEQGIRVSSMLEAEGINVPESVKHAMAAHNWSNTGVKPESKMDWALFCVDSLTGLITATAYMRPDRKIASVEVKSVLKKFKDKSFARGTRREDIIRCEDMLGIPLPEFIEITLKAMQSVGPDLGL